MMEQAEGLELLLSTEGNMSEVGSEGGQHTRSGLPENGGLVLL